MCENMPAKQGIPLKKKRCVYMSAFEQMGQPQEIIGPHAGIRNAVQGSPKRDGLFGFDGLSFAPV